MHIWTNYGGVNTCMSQPAGHGIQVDNYINNNKLANHRGNKQQRINSIVQAQWSYSEKPSK